MNPMTLPNGCSRELAESRLAMYDIRRRGGYKNQQIAARDAVKMSTGMGVRELRKWLADSKQYMIERAAANDRF